MPDIEIIVEASLGDSLAKLGLAKHAVDELGDSGDKTGQKLHDFNSAMDDATIASAKAGESILKTDHLIRDIENGIRDADNAISGESGGNGGGGFISALESMGNAADANIPLLFGMTVPLAALPIVAVAATAAIIALADALGTVIAIAADLVAPLTLVTGLVGGLGAAFFIAAKHAFGMHEDGFGKAIAGLKDQFDQLTHTLIADFMPVFQFLIHNAHDALDFLNKIAKLPLNEAFRQLARQGIPAVEQFLGKVGSIVAKPIRLAFQIAFGTGKAGNEAAAAVSHLWNQLSDFLFGYSVTHPIRLPSGRVIQLDKSHVNGIFQPLIDWFNRHDFTAQGIKIGHEILGGFLNSGAAKRMGDFLVQILVDAAKTAAVGMINALERLMAWILGMAQRAGAAFNHAMVSAAQSAWNAIVGIFSHPLSVVLDIIPHLLGSLPGGSNPLPGRGGGGAVPSPVGRVAGSPSPVGRAVVMHNTFHLHGATSAAAFTRQVREIGRELARQQHVLAGGA